MVNRTVEYKKISSDEFEKTEIIKTIVRASDVSNELSYVNKEIDDLEKYALEVHARLQDKKALLEDAAKKANLDIPAPKVPVVKFVVPEPKVGFFKKLIRKVGL